ncbi:hypothetical protein BDY21DRAFT_124690 [Lineolata rhizophorae]|uniref:Uncharacterized protein n=1 Tax=Lineolata rhizophorae TaxID=578093 RepID=A0A6A6NP21_9PEZI|nr:hypothetical protein BDY21DRAFT_124690 [Lineolata rhizophorae]
MPERGDLGAAALLQGLAQGFRVTGGWQLKGAVSLGARCRVAAGGGRLPGGAARAKGCCNGLGPSALMGRALMTEAATLAERAHLFTTARPRRSFRRTEGPRCSASDKSLLFPPLRAGDSLTPWPRAAKRRPRGGRAYRGIKDQATGQKPRREAGWLLVAGRGGSRAEGRSRAPWRAGTHMWRDPPGPRRCCPPALALPPARRCSPNPHPPLGPSDDPAETYMAHAHAHAPEGPRRSRLSIPA